MYNDLAAGLRYISEARVRLHARARPKTKLKWPLSRYRLCSLVAFHFPQSLIRLLIVFTAKLTSVTKFNYEAGELWPACVSWRRS